MKKVVFILGPTGVGKSSLAVALAKCFDGEIISADSVQIYKGLDIGSGKVTKDEMKNIPHHAIDIIAPSEQFSTFDFVELTKQKIDEIIERDKLPIVVGGTGLYIKAITQGYNLGGTAKDESLREYLQSLNTDKLFEMLQEKSPEMAQNIDRFNKVRLVRAVEIASLDGEKKTSETDIDPFIIALNMDREKLYAKINARVDEMFEKGLVGEVESLLKAGLTAENQSMRAIGYKEVISFLNGEIEYAKMVELVKQHSRNYAKRQLTFLRGMENVHFVDAEKDALEACEKLIGDWLNGKLGKN